MTRPKKPLTEAAQLKRAVSALKIISTRAMADSKDMVLPSYVRMMMADIVDKAVEGLGRGDLIK